MNYQGPFDKDELESSQKKESKPLPEKDFIQENQGLGGLPYWIWLFLLAVLLISFLGTVQWYQQYLEEEKGKEPFLEVTNRDFSAFLWQFPSFLRINVPVKTGYLPGFAIDGEEVKLSETESFVSAPPDLLFLYHTWSRLLSPDYISRPIEPKSFDEFLNKTQEWLPDNWRAAPKEFVELINSKSYKDMPDLQSLSDKQLPKIVRLSYEGWKNYFEEGPAINELSPTYGQVQEFLKKHPNYARNFWRNISEVADQQVAGIDYLSAFLKPIANPDEKVPADELAPFLKVALYNATQAAQGK